MTATIITIGDEILIGQIVNTNAAWLGEQLTSLGIDVIRMVTVGDGEEAIRTEVRRSIRDSQLVLCTGGLGPTHDDITKHAMAREFGDRLILNEEVLAAVKERFERRGRVMVASNNDQALVPESFRAIVNSVGTAPALVRGFSSGVDGLDGLLVVMPGVPHEMMAFVQNGVLQEIGKLGGTRAIVQRTLLTSGIGESNLEEMLTGVRDRLRDGLSLAWLPSIHGVRIRVTARAESADDAGQRVDELVAWIRDRVGTYVWGEGTDELEAAVGRQLAQRGWTIGTAESCTGGLIAHRLTNVPGASDYMLGSIVSYGNSVKYNSLGVREEDIMANGAVSETVARQMADGARRVLGVDVAISTTGIMGPGGGTDDKPVGTVWVGLATPEKTTAIRLTLGNDRLRNKERAATGALNALRQILS